MNAIIEELRAAGSTVHYITTDETAKEAMGLNSLDPLVRGAAAFVMADVILCDRVACLADVELNREVIAP